jgi:hypothetical protein
MCGNAPARVPTLAPASQPFTTAARPAMRPTVSVSAASVSAAETLIQHLRLTRRLQAEVQDLYSRRASRPVSPEPDRDAA